MGHYSKAIAALVVPFVLAAFVAAAEGLGVTLPAEFEANLGEVVGGLVVLGLGAAGAVAVAPKNK